MANTGEPPADQPPPQESAAPSSAPPAVPTAVPTGPATFTKEALPCELLGEELVAKLVPQPTQSQIYKEECEWDTGATLPANMSHSLKIYVKVYPGDVAKAHEQLGARRDDAKLLSDSTWPLTPPVGDDSFVAHYTLEGSNQGPTIAVVGVRVSNAVIEVTYNRRVTEDPTGRLIKGATEVAAAIAAKLPELA
jgi:hypothetical protein